MVRSESVLCIGVVLTLGIVSSPGGTGYAAKWDPIDPKELALTSPSVERDADAEALLWDVQVADEFVAHSDLQTVYQHHLRIKIFTDRAREAQSRVDIPHSGSVRIRDVEGRSIKRDGTFVELKGSDVFERDLAKAGGVKVRATSFVLPAVETLGIIEYRWREVHDNVISQDLRLPLSRDIPVQLVKYHIAPLDLSGTTYVMKARSFHAEPTPIVRDGPKFFVTTLANVPAFREEPDAPSEWEVRPWLLVYYADRTEPAHAAEFWQKYSHDVAVDTRKATAPSDAIRSAAAKLVPATASLDEKIKALVQFCRAKIKRVDVDTISDAERRGFRRNESPTAALASGRGTARDVAELFVAMARALGLDARLALLPSRDDVTFDPSLLLPQLFGQIVIAVAEGGKWRFLDPSNEYEVDGHLEWSQEGLPVLIPDEGAVIAGRTPCSPPEFSTRSRTATLTLLEDGTIEGDVTTEFSGHLDAVLKEQDDHLAAAEREESLKDLLAERLPGIEMTNLRISNVTELGEPYTNSYHFRIPGYAQRTGSRIFFQPAVFQKGVPARFSSPQRRYPLWFDHAWRDVDRIRIALPPGYELEAADAPRDVSFGRVGGCTTDLKRTPDGRAIEMTRTFFFGGDERLAYPATSYVALKMFFDEVYTSDARTLTLRKSAASPESR
jgi:transglutaminase-like putative cysteine protease